MSHFHILWISPLVLTLLLGCSAQPQTFQDGLKFPSEQTQNRDYSGPKFMIVDVSTKRVVEALESRLVREGFRPVNQGPDHRSYQINETGHDLVKKARVSFKFVRRGRELWIYTRARAQLDGLTVFDGTMTDVSDRKPARRRFRKLFRQVKSKLNVQKRF